MEGVAGQATDGLRTRRDHFIEKPHPESNRQSSGQRAAFCREDTDERPPAPEEDAGQVRSLTL